MERYFFGKHHSSAKHIHGNPVHGGFLLFNPTLISFTALSSMLLHSSGALGCAIIKSNISSAERADKSNGAISVIHHVVRWVGRVATIADV
jgi:hypothetical protein